MFNFKKIFSLLALTLLLFSCSRKLSRHSLIGIWQLECYTPENNSKYSATTAYTSDGSFETQTTSSFLFYTHNTLFSGTYKANKKKLQETITYSSRPTGTFKLPQTQVSNLNWIDENSLAVTTGDVSCTATRKKNS